MPQLQDNFKLQDLTVHKLHGWLIISSNRQSQVDEYSAFSAHIWKKAKIHWSSRNSSSTTWPA